MGNMFILSLVRFIPAIMYFILIFVIKFVFLISISEMASTAKSRTESSTVLQLDKREMISAYRGKHIKDVQSDATSMFFEMKKSAVNCWGLVYFNKCLRLCFSNKKTFKVIIDAEVIGSVFKKNLGTDSLQEALVILVAENDSEETSALCFGKGEYGSFAQSKVDEFLLTSTEFCASLLRSDFPVTPVSNDGASISQYLNAILAWGKQPYTEIFEVVKRGGGSQLQIHRRILLRTM